MHFWNSPPPAAFAQSVLDNRIRWMDYTGWCWSSPEGELVFNLQTIRTEMVAMLIYRNESLIAPALRWCKYVFKLISKRCSVCVIHLQVKTDNTSGVKWWAIDTEWKVLRNCFSDHWLIGWLVGWCKGLVSEKLSFWVVSLR